MKSTTKRWKNLDIVSNSERPGSIYKFGMFIICVIVLSLNTFSVRPNVSWSGVSYSLCVDECGCEIGLHITHWWRMRQWTVSSLVQIIAFRLFGIKRNQCWVSVTWNKYLLYINHNINSFVKQNISGKGVSKKRNHFVHVSIRMLGHQATADVDCSDPLWLGAWWTEMSVIVIQQIMHTDSLSSKYISTVGDIT